ncbi:MAG TPA: thiamine pyrophosphate-binding protein, partial [Candidatus Sulfotelmatobacter sp.]|nr:thiamine pyrophosphate-binding protein [Candidatus Sulfotelmatobacter sp.]
MTPGTTGGQALVAALADGGVRQAFTVPGESFLGVLDALRDSPIRTVATRHEGGAAFMAEGYGQLSGRPAVCLATRAVGAANLAIGLHTATADSTPLVAVIGQVPRDRRGREAFQEVDLVATFGRLCKAAVEIDDPAAMGPQTARLLALARSGRPGPVLLAVPEDVVEGVITASTLAVPASRPAGPPSPAPPPAEVLRTVLTALAGASAPLIVAGAGVLRAEATGPLARFADRFTIPVVARWRPP